ncbi:hypothetical protein BDV95DRAFT_616615 [Massariosphaeria phaeospora]|uniref:Uncharacterized protein n=1 Tax=Massariosphaeria phaeospora TaxID=100035 RepID=A0A7C8MPB0_9PLEO|nr:hypothetical protein BDV95DRAFT_616615 [Massariosphaeria phaeospora]
MASLESDNTQAVEEHQKEDELNAEHPDGDPHRKVSGTMEVDTKRIERKCKDPKISSFIADLKRFLHGDLWPKVERSSKIVESRHGKLYHGKVFLGAYKDGPKKGREAWAYLHGYYYFFYYVGEDLIQIKALLSDNNFEYQPWCEHFLGKCGTFGDIWTSRIETVIKVVMLDAHLYDDLMAADVTGSVSGHLRTVMCKDQKSAGVRAPQNEISSRLRSLIREGFIELNPAKRDQVVEVSEDDPQHPVKNNSEPEFQVVEHTRQIKPGESTKALGKRPRRSSEGLESGGISFASPHKKPKARTSSGFRRDRRDSIPPPVDVETVKAMLAPRDDIESRTEREREEEATNRIALLELQRDGLLDEKIKLQVYRDDLYKEKNKLQEENKKLQDQQAQYKLQEQRNSELVQTYKRHNQNLQRDLAEDDKNIVFYMRQFHELGHFKKKHDKHAKHIVLAIYQQDYKTKLGCSEDEARLGAESKYQEIFGVWKQSDEDEPADDEEYSG